MNDNSGQEQQVEAVEAQQQAPQQTNDVFDDNFSDEQLGALFGEAVDAMQAEMQENDAHANQVQEQEKAEEQPQENDTQAESYEVEIFDGQKVKLSNDELQQAVEFGATYAKNRQDYEQGLQLATAVKQDPKLQAVLKAYVQGQPLAQFDSVQPLQATPATAQVAPQEQQQYQTQNEAMQAFEAQVIKNAIPQLLPLVMKQIQEHYQPFVDNVNKFEQNYNIQREFAEIQKDKDYAEVDNLLVLNVKHKLNDGVITVQQAAEIEQRLRTDPKFYKEWFGKFKTAMKNKPQQTSQAVEAPKIKSNQTAINNTDSFADARNKALQTGSAEALGSLF